MPIAALLASPATLLWGPVVAFNLLTLLAHPLACVACFALAFELTGDFAASAIAGFLFGFSGYLDGQALGHLDLDLVFLMPILVLLAVRRARGKLGRAPFVTTLALALAAQFGLSTELFATAILAGGLTLACIIVAADQRRPLVRLAVECLAAAGVAGVAISPMLVSMARHTHEMPDFINTPAVYSNDLLNLVVPTKAEALRLPVTKRLALLFSGNAEEQDLYLGVPLLAILVLFTAGARGWRLAMVVSIGLLTLASLGPVLHVAGRKMPVPLPWVLASDLPLLRAALPCRLGVYVALGASVAAACWIARRPSPARLGLGVLACLFLLPGSARESWTRIDVPRLFTGPRTTDIFAGRTALLLPFASADTMLWQASADMGFAQAGGVLSFIPLRLQREPVVLPLLRNEAMPGFTAALAGFARRHGVGVIAVGPGTSVALRHALEATGWPRRIVGGMELIAVRSEDRS